MNMGIVKSCMELGRYSCFYVYFYVLPLTTELFCHIAQSGAELALVPKYATGPLLLR